MIYRGKKRPEEQRLRLLSEGSLLDKRSFWGLTVAWDAACSWALDLLGVCEDCSTRPRLSLIDRVLLTLPPFESKVDAKIQHQLVMGRLYVVGEWLPETPVSVCTKNGLKAS